MSYKIKDELANKPDKLLKIIAKKQEFEEMWSDASDTSNTSDDSGEEEPAAKRLKK